MTKNIVIDGDFFTLFLWRWSDFYFSIITAFNVIRFGFFCDSLNQ